MLTINSVDVKGKAVFLRVDVNSPVERGKVMDSERIEAHANTIRELSDKGAKLVVLGHQGRPGDKDFTSLSEHAALLSKHAGKKIEFVPDIMGPYALDKIRNLKNGEIILLDNVRLLSEERLKLDIMGHSQRIFIRKLAPLGDLFVNDAFSASHRSHASVVGFTPLMKSVAGRVFENEVNNISRFMDYTRKPFVLVIGGKKVDEVIDVLVNLAPKADKILVGGAVSLLFLKALGKNLGKAENFLEREGLNERFDEIKTLYTRFSFKFVLPVDVAVKSTVRKVISVKELPTMYDIMDIGNATARLFSKELSKAKMVIMKGPMGVFEKKQFAHGTRIVLKAIERTKCLSLLGGGHTSTLVDLFRIDKKKITYISLAGGAFIEYISGKKLPGLEALK